jgi:hypothetical protein
VRVFQVLISKFENCFKFWLEKCHTLLSPPLVHLTRLPFKTTMHSGVRRGPRFRRSRRLQWVVAGVAVVLLVVVMGVLWVLHDGVRIPHASAPARTLAGGDRLQEPPALTKAVHVMQAVPVVGGELLEGAAGYLFRLLHPAIHAPSLVAQASLDDTVAGVVDALLAALPAAGAEGASMPNNQGVLSISLQVAGTGVRGQHREVLVGHMWSPTQRSSEWAIRRLAATPRLPPLLNRTASPSGAGWYCLVVTVANMALEPWETHQVLTTSFVLTDPASKHTQSEFGVTPTRLRLYPPAVVVPASDPSVVILQSVAPNGAASVITGIYPTPMPTEAAPHALSMLLRLLPPRSNAPVEHSPALVTLPAGVGRDLLEAHRRATRTCVDVSGGRQECVPLVYGMGSFVTQTSLTKTPPILNGTAIRREVPPMHHAAGVASTTRRVSSFADLKGWVEEGGPEVDVAMVEASIRIPQGQSITVPHGRHIALLFCEECSLLVGGSLVASTSTAPPLARLTLRGQSARGWGGVVAEAGGRVDLSDTVISGTGSSRVKRMKGTGTHIKSAPAVTVAPSPTHHGVPLSDIKGPAPIHPPQVVLNRCVLVDLHGPGLGLGRGSTAVLVGVLVQAAAQGLECVECTLSVHSSAFIDIPHSHYEYSTFRDEDNDGLYFRGGHAEVVGCVIANTADDGIDSASNRNDPMPSSLTIRNTVISNIQHEGIALSGSAGAHRTVVVEDVVIEGCQQGIENGHSPNTHHATLRRVLLIGNQIGIRYGDDYKLAVEGHLTGEQVFFMAGGNNPELGNTVQYADIVLSEMRKHSTEVHHGKGNHNQWLEPNAFHYRRQHELFNCSLCVLVSDVPQGPSPLMHDGAVCGEPVVSWTGHE